MIIVSDTTPLRYLVEIECIDVLHRLFGIIYTSPKILDELQHSAAPAIVRAWATTPPDWLNVKAPAELINFERRLHDGEAEAMSLAHELRPSRLLTDDRAAWHEAAKLGLRPVRTLPLIWIAAELKLLDLDETLSRLEKTTFRVTPRMIDRYRRRDMDLQKQFDADVKSARSPTQPAHDRDRSDNA